MLGGEVCGEHFRYHLDAIRYWGIHNGAKTGIDNGKSGGAGAVDGAQLKRQAIAILEPGRETVDRIHRALTLQHGQCGLRQHHGRDTGHHGLLE